MKQRTRIHYTQTQKAMMWERWKAGESLHQIARLFDRNHSSIQKILQVTGGIRPAPRQRSPRMLTLAEREEISRCLAAGQTIRFIARLLGRAPSTISREVSRNGGCESYRAGGRQTPVTVLTGADCWLAQKCRAPLAAGDRPHCPTWQLRLDQLHIRVGDK